MSVTVALARNTIIQTLGKVVSVALGWLIVITMTNYLGARGFGAYTIMTTYLQFFGVAIDLGFVLVSSQLLAEAAAADRERVFANLLTFRLCTGAAVLVLAPVAIWAFPYSLVVKQGVAVLTLSFLFVALLQVFTGLFQTELAVGRSLAGELTGRLVLLGTVGYAAWHGQSLLFIVSGVVVGSVLNLGLVFILARRFVRVHLAYDAALWRTIWQRAWPIAAGIVFNLVYLKADTLVLSLTRSEAEVGVYGAVYRVLEVLITFPTMFAGLLLPVLSVAWVNRDLKTFSLMLQQGLGVVLLAAWPLVVGVALTAPRLVALFGHDFLQAGGVLLLLVLATAVIFVGTFFGHTVVAVGKQRSMISAYALTAGGSLVGYLVFIPRYGAYGAAAMTVVAESFIATLAYMVVRRMVGIRPSFKPLRTAVVASLPMALFLWVSAPLPLVPIVLGAAGIYLGMLYALGALPREFLWSVFTTAPSSSQSSGVLSVFE